MWAYLDVSQNYRGQLQFKSEDPFFAENSGYESMLTKDLHIINQDRAFDICQDVSGAYQLKVSDAAMARLAELRNQQKPETASFIDPFEGFELKGFQKRAINVMERENNILLQLSPGCGKAQPNDEPVLTPDGWVPIGELKEGDIVYDRFGEHAEVSGIFKWPSEEEFEVTLADGRKTRCSGGHYWCASIQRKNGEHQWRMVQTREMLERGIKKNDGGYRFAIPLTEPIKYEPKKLPVDPYVLGVLLGDGALGQAGVVFSSDEPDIAERLQMLLGEEYLVHKYKAQNYSWGIRYLPKPIENPLKSAIRELGLNVGSHDKFIPKEYLTASVEQRRELLAGLFDTDGSVQKNGRFSFSTVSERLKDDVTTLCRSLGYAVTLFEDRRKERVCYEIGIGTNERIFRSKKHAARFDEHQAKANRCRYYDSISIADIKKTGRVLDMTCISVWNRSRPLIWLNPDDTYITRDYIVTHNTLTSIFMACQRKDQARCGRIVVWCPIALLPDWVNEIKRSTTLSVGTPNRHWSVDRRREFYETDDSDVWVLNYERLRTLDKEPIERALKRQTPLFIMDEVQKLKNRASTIHKEHAKLVRHTKAAGVIALTATPIVKGPEDFYNEFRIIQPDIFGTVKEFEHNFTVNNGERTMWNDYVGYQNLAYMHVMTGAQVFSASKTQPEIAAEFPAKQEILLPYELSRQERKLYDEIFDYGQSLGVDFRCGPLFVLTFMRICNMPEILLNPHEYAGGEYGRQNMEIDAICRRYAKAIEKSANSAKLELATEKVDEITGAGEKLIVFAQHTHNCLFPLAEHWKKYNPLLYTGEASLEEKERIKYQFKNDPNSRLLLMSDAGQVGLNFQECRYLLHYQTPTSHAAYEQRSDRVHRLDSAHDSITVFRMMGIDTVEERVEETMQGRRMLAGEMGFEEEYEEYGAITQDDADFFCGF